MNHQYRFRRGGRVRINSGKYNGATGTVDSKVFQYSVDYAAELGAAYHVVLDDGKVIMVRVERASLRANTSSPIFSSAHTPPSIPTGC